LGWEGGGIRCGLLGGLMRGELGVRVWLIWGGDW
jgi:hypothetical protein